MPERRILLALLCFLTLVVFLEARGAWLFDPDEARYAEIPREMLATGEEIYSKLVNVCVWH